jgi:hypothetical protein
VGSIPASRTKTEGPSVKLGPFSFKLLHSENIARPYTYTLKHFL